MGAGALLLVMALGGAGLAWLVVAGRVTAQAH